MNNDNQNLNAFGEAIINKFVNEEIMTKSELDQKLDNVMSKYVAHIDQKIDTLKHDMDKRFAQIDIRYNWIIGLIITATIGLAGVLIKLH
jgi:hypothetical protein